MTFAEMKADVRRRLAETPVPSFWSDDDIGEALNLGYAEISDATEWLEEYVDVSLLNNRPYYDLWRVVGDNILSVKPSYDRQTDRWLIPSSVRQLDAHDRRWERVTGEPQRVFTRGLRWLGLWPRIQSDLGTFKVYYTRLPDPLVNDDDEPGFDDTWHRGLVAFALADLWAQDGETALAQTAWTAYLQSEAGLGGWVQGRNGMPLVRGNVGSSVPANVSR